MITYRNLGRNGQLGNQLWQIASTIGIARSEGDSVGFPFWRYARYFCITGSYFPDLDTAGGRDLGLDYLQDQAHFAAVADEVRQCFRPRQEVWSRLESRFAAVRALPHTTSLHVRRGDYLLHDDAFLDLPLEWYREAMSLTRGPYLVFSDDLPWCRANLGGDCVFMDYNRDYEDLFLMAACDEHIIANSTFSWWAAFLSGGRTIMPRQWGRAFDDVEGRFATSATVLLDVPVAPDNAVT